MRGKGWTEQELKNVISGILTSVEKFEKTIEELKEDEEKGIRKYPADNVSAIRGFHDLCYRSKVGLIHALYSLGEDIDTLIPHFNEAVMNLDCSYLRSEYSPANNMWGDYGALLQIAALGILLETDDDTMRKISDAIFYHNVEDALIDFLLSAYDIGWTHQTGRYFQPRPYQATRDIILAAQMDKAEAAGLLEVYMKKKLHTKNGWNYEIGAVAKILGLDDSGLKKSSNYPYDLVHYGDTKKFLPDAYSVWLERIRIRKQGQEQVEKEKEYIKEVEMNYCLLDNKTFYEKYKERFLKEIFMDEIEYYNFQTKKEEGILGFLLVNLLVKDGYILQIDYKDNPEKYLIDFVNERLEMDYNNEPIEEDESDRKFENIDAEIELYDTKYVKKIQRKLKRKGFQSVWFQLNNDQYYMCILPKSEVLEKTWHEVKLITV